MVSSLPFLACALLAGSGLGSLCDPEYASALSRGQERHRAFAYEEAIGAFNEALLRDPTGFHALVGLADAWNDRGELSASAAAEDAFARALGHAQCLEEVYPHRPEGPYWAAVTYGNRTALGGAREKVALSREIARAARRALAADPDFPPALVALGIYERQLASLGFFARTAARTMLGGIESASLEESERLLQRAVALSPESLLAHYELGLTLLSARKPVAAAAELRRVLDLPTTEATDLKRQLDASARLSDLEPP